MRASATASATRRLRIDEVHHTIAMFPSKTAGIQHINHQVESGDNVMRSFHFLNERQVHMVFGPGRHPTSSARFLYFEGPDGMVFEYSSGVRSIADGPPVSGTAVPHGPERVLQMGCEARYQGVSVSG